MPYETIEYSLEDHVAKLVYNRPQQRNAISRQVNAELHEAWQSFRDDEDAFVLVITGAGDAFCAGWDLADAAATLSMWMRKDSHSIGASAFKEGRKPEWPNHGL